MKMLSRKSQGHSSLRALAVAVLLVAMCGAAGAQVNVPVEITIGPTDAPPPFPPNGACAKREDTAKKAYIICVSLEPINMGAYPADKENTITWTIATSGWTFEKNKGIDVKNRKFWKVEPDKSDPKKFVATNKRDGENYKYDINLVNEGTKLPLGWDPSIMN